MDQLSEIIILRCFPYFKCDYYDILGPINVYKPYVSFTMPFNVIAFYIKYIYSYEFILLLVETDMDETFF